MTVNDRQEPAVAGVDLLDQLATAEANVAQLRRAIAQGPCVRFGHDWRHIGGCNASCGEDGCGCSVPVHECSKCGDCDYGDNSEAATTRDHCRQLRAESAR